MQKVTWKNPNKAWFNSLHKTYNNTIVCPSPGNTIDPGYLGLYVRAWNETECNGRTWEPGHLYNFDMESFRQYRVPSRIAELAKNGGILYCLRHFNGGRAIVHGWLLTDRNHNEIARVYARNNYKSDSVLDTFIPYVVGEREQKYPF